jgi:hypothetical protein
MTEPYSFFAHRHRFAAWAAARASQRRWGVSTPAILDAIEASGLPDLVADRARWPATAEAFDATHRDICQRIIQRVSSTTGKKSSFGLAAKAVAIYLKSMVVLGPDSNTSFASVVHPPIDRNLLQALAGDGGLNTSLRAVCRGCNWTQLDEQGYYDLLGQIRRAGLHKPAFWMLERYWDLSQES